MVQLRQGVPNETDETLGRRHHGCMGSYKKSVIVAVRKPTQKNQADADEMTTAVTSTIRATRGPVDAPGKRHRKPPPQEQIDKRMGEATGKQMGQKNVKNGMRRGRG